MPQQGEPLPGPSRISTRSSHSEEDSNPHADRSSSYKLSNKEVDTDEENTSEGGELKTTTKNQKKQEKGLTKNNEKNLGCLEKSISIEKETKY